MTHDFLQLLKPVSRSFYLTIRALPRTLREPVALAYLLARASDTIADTPHVPAEVRLEKLHVLRQALAGKSDGFTGLCKSISPGTEGERLLLERLQECLEAFRAAAECDREAIADVLEKIVRGQELDLLRFSIRCEAVKTADELEEYTYLVAGCVGEFWTRICALHLPAFARLDKEHMSGLGVRFGKGLQLINILRDLPEDLRGGRLYLPQQELLEAGADTATMEGAEPVFERWRHHALEHMKAAYEYIAALPAGRVRYACILPWRIGILTLRKIGATPPWKTSERIKVSRPEVRNTCFWAVFAALSNGALKGLEK